jgi:transcriptional regulator with XRE-family HTH domain
MLINAMPTPVKDVLENFGANLNTARKRRKLSALQVAQKLGLDQRSVLDAEKGKPTTSIATYIALLWVYDLLGDMQEIANPLKDTEGIRLSLSRKNKTIKSELDNDF